MEFRVVQLLASFTLFFSSTSLPQQIPIAGLFDGTSGRDDRMGILELAFRNAVKRINADRSILPGSSLNESVFHILPRDSFKASKKVCEVMNRGVVAVFGPRNPQTSGHVQSICDTLEVPHVEATWSSDSNRDSFSINVFPHHKTLGMAYLDLLKELNWKSFTILYESNEGLVRLQEILKAKDPENFKVLVRQLSADGDHRPLLKSLKKAGQTHILLDCETPKIHQVLTQAQQIGLITAYHNYIVTSLDLHTVDLENFKYGGTNITGLRLVNTEDRVVQDVLADWDTAIPFLRDYSHSYTPKSQIFSSTSISVKSLTTEAALLYDAVHLLAKALHDLDNIRAIQISPLTCNSDDVWTEGRTLINYMKMTEMRGLSGIVRFDGSGARSNFNLDILELSKQGLKVVGLWEPGKGANYTRNWKDLQRQIQEKLENKTLIVTTALSSPYTMEKENKEHLEGNDRFEGFCMDLIDEISQILHFNYTYKLVDDGSYGAKDKDTGEWNGMIRELLDRKADLAIADLTISYQREQAVDFSMPWMNLGISILFKKPTKKEPNLFSFLSPLSIDVWIYMATAYLGVSVLLFVLARFSPYEWDNPHPCVEDPDVLENKYNLLNSLWFTIGSLMQQGSDIAPKFTPYEWVNTHPCRPDPDELENELTLSNAFWHKWGSLMQQGSDIAPKAVSTRIVAGMWWFFTLIMISSYTANLAAFLTVERMESPIDSVEDLAKQTKIKYGSLKSGSTTTFFRESKFPTYQRMWSFMENQRPSVFTKDNAEGVERVKKGNGDYAYLMESTSIEYQIERNCELTQVGGLLDNKGYGIALPPGSPYTSAISSAVLQMQEKGRFLVLKRRWWKERRGGGKCEAELSKGSGAANELGLANVGGVFVVLMGGMGIACIIAVCEFVWKSRKLAIEERASLCQEMAKELKFALKCRGDTKPVRKQGGMDGDAILSPLSSGYSTQFGVEPGQYGHNRKELVS
ncbi:unnamed protein product [Darwinula stevensoni]|uniref:Uncharacterized protein n=1 Tax=Darwinula stevensoni TaxID=69355 RepID=A0A7R8X411_9CRUS|nr:unnamed protein product [Darwinula stevensoni]CAG0878614.1 unnamed protein product [Darwinula stevensoni]